MLTKLKQDLKNGMVFIFANLGVHPPKKSTPIAKIMYLSTNPFVSR